MQHNAKIHKRLFSIIVFKFSLCSKIFLLDYTTMPYILLLFGFLYKTNYEAANFILFHSKHSFGFSLFQILLLSTLGTGSYSVSASENLLYSFKRNRSSGYVI